MRDGVERLLVRTADDRELEVLVSGPQGAPVLVFHHGTPDAPVPLPAFLDPSPFGLRTVMYARPGYASSTPQWGRLIGNAASDTAEILDALGIDTFVNIGWSGGGPHALSCAALLPRRCLATAVVAGLSPYPGEAWTQENPFRITSKEGDELEAGLEPIRLEGLATTKDDIVAMFHDNPWDLASLTDEFAEWLAASARLAFAVSAAGFRDDNKAFQRPWGFELADAQRVAIWHGDCDDHNPLAHGQWLADRIPGSQLHVLPNEGHASIGWRFPDIVQDLIQRAST